MVDSVELTFLVVQVVTLALISRITWQAHTMALRVQPRQKLVKLLLISWALWGLSVAFNTLFWIIVIFGGRLVPELSAYRAVLVAVNAAGQLIPAVGLTILWQRLTQ